ncbi:MAG: riboflavin biosynthesis protein RibF [Sumerlaeia bacterium]
MESPPGGVHVAVGTFDGVHRAHSQLLGRVAGEAHATNGLAMVFTFQNHPRTVLSNSDKPLLITDWELKQKALSKLPIDLLVGIAFDQEFASIPAEEFIRNVLVEKCHAKTIHSGKNFRFGKGGVGGPGLLEECSTLYNYRYEQLEMIVEGSRRISSTRIREALWAGECQTATELLGRPFMLRGVVVTGDSIGRTIGFPTANLSVSPQTLRPLYGVYGGSAYQDSFHRPVKALLNIGVRPTVSGKEERIEVHLLNWEGELIGKELSFQFLFRLRDEQRFAGLAELKEQLNRDRRKALEELAAPAWAPYF